MKSEPLEVNGETIRNGTSLFHKQTEEVLWFKGVQDGYVQLETVEEAIEMPRDRFQTHILKNDIVVQAQPPGYPD